MLNSIEETVIYTVLKEQDDFVVNESEKTALLFSFDCIDRSLARAHFSFPFVVRVL